MDGAVLHTPGATQRPPDVRLASPADEQAVFDLFMLAAQENAMAPVSADKVMTAIRMATERKGGVLGVIDGDKGEIASAVLLVMTPFWYTDTWHVEDFLNFVRPEYRVGRRTDAKQLIQFSKWWADQLGIALLMGVLTEKRTEGKVRLYRRQLPYRGAVFLYQGSAA